MVPLRGDFKMCKNWNMSEKTVPILFVGDGFLSLCITSYLPFRPTLLGDFPACCGRRNASPTPLQIEIWRGKTGHRTTLSFRTSAYTGVGISIEFQATYRHTGHSLLPFSGIHPRKGVLLSGGLPRQCDHWLAMTRNSIARQIPICRFAALIR